MAHSEFTRATSNPGSFGAAPLPVRHLGPVFGQGGGDAARRPDGGRHSRETEWRDVGRDRFRRVLVGGIDPFTFPGCIRFLPFPLVPAIPAFRRVRTNRASRTPIQAIRGQAQTRSVGRFRSMSGLQRMPAALSYRMGSIANACVGESVAYRRLDGLGSTSRRPIPGTIAGYRLTIAACRKGPLFALRMVCVTYCYEDTYNVDLMQGLRFTVCPGV